MLSEIREGLKLHFEDRLVDELLSAYEQAKHNFFLGGLRLNAVEGGRFCEAALRILEEAATGTFTPLNTPLDSEKIISRLAGMPKAALSDSLRLHIPRAIRVVYDIRNKRDAAHLADGIDPNLQDATLVSANLDWILAEFVRLYHGVTADRAQQIIEQLVARKAPVVRDFSGFLKVLNPALKVSDRIMLLLYERGEAGASKSELEQWLPSKMRSNLRRTLTRLVDDLAYVHVTGELYFLTKTGVLDVEGRNLHGIS